MNPDPTRERRLLGLCAVGAVAGLLIAGIGLFTAQGTRLWTLPAQDAAVVNGIPILRSDLIDQIRALDDSGYAETAPARRRAVLDDMIREELTVQRGIEMGLANDDIDVRAALAKGVAARLGTDEMGRPVPEAMLHAWYDRHRASYVSTGIIAVTDLSSAGLSSAEGAGSPAFYPQVRARMAARLFATAVTMRAGERSAPIPMPDGVHILAVSLNQPPRRLPFEAVRERVLGDVHEARFRARLAADRQDRRHAAIITIAGDLR